ncbi:MAG: diheme cytochrome c [Candidatus Manganitrophus sp.]|nr:diheme cytochrome c [Candidatus Manganitrophus sp.]MDC4225916.1 diheme cytochrome c [Candidatus Manganitrophus sp.]WDT72798.1 MAG: diheme cytochrome c [Candidatus Manganitrophus sp.]WDT79719.1 MAG: diheme cytochrome c [Candidatus Manganitrophus sp.]
MKTSIWMALVIGGLFLIAGYWRAMGGEEEMGERLMGSASRSAVIPVSNDLYTKECGACHLAYPPGLLPARSWERLMNGLSDHFGDNAELAPEDQSALTDYLVKNAADRSGQKRSAKVVRSLKNGEAPLRISEVPYIVRKHHEIPSRLIQGNPKVKSLSNCNACHKRAESGAFNEHDVSIPGHGAWDD